MNIFGIKDEGRLAKQIIGDVIDSPYLFDQCALIIDALKKASYPTETLQDRRIAQLLFIYNKATL